MGSYFSSTFWFQIAYFLVALFLCALFSFLETSITALRLFNLKEISQSNTRYKNLLTVLEQEPQRVLISILIASNLANVTAAAVITRVMEELFAHLQLSEGLGFSLGIAIATTAILIIGEIIPKNMAQTQGSRLFTSTLGITNIIFTVLSPINRVLSAISNCVIRLFKSKDAPSGTETMVSEKEIQFLIDYINQQGGMDTDKTQMLHSIFDLGKTTVKEIMVPETDVITLNVDSTLNEALEIFARYHFSRLPVYEGKMDNIIGMVHQKDIFLLMSKGEQRLLKELVRPILFVPESMKANQLLRQFKQQHRHIAMVLNEYGGIIGLVTLEDAIEEIVGDINDEHESTQEQIVPLEQGGWLVYAGIDLDELEKFLNIPFKTEEAVTLGGFMIEHFEHLPKKGEQLLYHGYTLEVQKSTHKRIVQVLIHKEK